MSHLGNSNGQEVANNNQQIASLHPSTSPSSPQLSAMDQCGGGEREGAERRQCWICYGEETIAIGNIQQERRWVQPCQCKGTAKWVHQQCLLTWVDAQGRNGSTSPGGSSTDGSNYLVTPKTVCPQCHATYRIVERRVLPTWFLSLIDRSQKVKDYLVTYGSLLGLASSVWILSVSYGLGTLSLLLGPDEAASQLTRFVPPQSWTDVAHLTRLLIGIPMIPIFTLSIQYNSLTWFYPLIPLLTFSGGDALRWGWPMPKSTAITFLPFVMESYGWSMRRQFFPMVKRSLAKRINLRNGSSSASHLASPAASLSPRPTSPFSLNANSGSALTSPATSMDIASNPLSHLEILFSDNGDMDEEEEINAVRGYLYDLASTLMFPAAAASLGWILFGRSTTWTPFTRSLAAASILTVASDVIDLLYWWQKLVNKSYRRVLDHSIET